MANTAIEYYRDFYGCSASIHKTRDGRFYLTVADAHGRRVRETSFKTHRGAVRAMNNDSDGTMERVK